MKQNREPTHYLMAQSEYSKISQAVYKDFIADELGEEFAKQLHYEAACEGLRELKKYIETLPSHKKQYHAMTFYREKLKHLQSIAHQFQKTPYTL
jgi:hypothetical protein